jgi:hypothetical protein
VDETLNNVSFVLQALSSTTKLVTKFRQIMATQVFHLGILQMVPNALGRVQFRGIGGKLLQVDAFGSAICQEVLDGLASMRLQAIPQDQKLARDVMQEMLEKAHNIGTSEGATLTIMYSFPSGVIAAMADR